MKILQLYYILQIAIEKNNKLRYTLNIKTKEGEKKMKNAKSLVCLHTHTQII